MKGKIEGPGVARLAAEGFTATETAEKLGISRQRVYQIAARDGIKFALRSRGVARLAAEGFTATETAEKLGISRQRVYQIAARDGIKFALRSRMWAQPTKPLAFAGIQRPLGTRVVGTIAELLVAADLLTRGWWVYTPVALHRGHDIVACRGDEIITVEVRTVRDYTNKHQGKAASSHFAWVKTGEPILYEPPLTEGAD